MGIIGVPPVFLILLLYCFLFFFLACYGSQIK